MKKVLIIIAYWLAAIFLTTMLLVSLDYTMAQALLMSLTSGSCSSSWIRMGITKRPCPPCS